MSAEDNKEEALDLTADEGQTETAKEAENKGIEKEAAESLSDLTRKKHAEKEFWAENNLAQTQIFINSMDGNLNFGHKQTTETLKSPKEGKRYNLQKQDECAEFVEAYRDGEYLAVALILCTFEAVVVGDLPELQLKMLNCLPVTNTEDGEENAQPRQDPYLSLNTILEVIGGKRFTMGDEQTCIGLGDGSAEALKHMMEQFPMLRNVIVRWLIQLNDNYKYRTSFDARQIAVAFARMISLDMYDAKRRIFPQLYSNADNAELLGTVLYLLYQDMEHRADAENILRQWMRSGGKWLWKSACMTCFFLEKDQQVIYKEDLKKTIQKNMLFFQRRDWAFVVELLFDSRYFRTLFAEIFRDAYDESNNRTSRKIWAGEYVDLVRRCYYKVNHNRMELPLVVCDTRWQQQCLAPMIKMAMTDYYLRKQLYLILEAYLEELSNDTYSETTLKHLDAYFYNMASVMPEYLEDIQYFLRKCQNKVAKQIYQCLCQIYKKRGELSLHE